MPALGRLLDKFEARGFAIVGINVDEVKENGLQFAEKHGLKFTLLYDKNRKLLEAAGVMIMPTSFMVNRNGKIIWIQSGFRDGDESALGQDIEKFLSKK